MWVGVGSGQWGEGLAGSVVLHQEAYSWGVGEYDSEDGCDGFREGV